MVRLEERVDHELPVERQVNAVRTPVPVPGNIEVFEVVGDCSELRDDWRRRVGGEVRDQPDHTVVLRGGELAQAGPAELDTGERRAIGHAHERPGEVVAPGVVPAGEPAGAVAAVGHDLRTPVRADVGESVHHIVLVPGEYDREPQLVACHHGAGFGQVGCQCDRLRPPGEQTWIAPGPARRGGRSRWPRSSTARCSTTVAQRGDRAWCG